MFLNFTSNKFHVLHPEPQGCKQYTNTLVTTVLGQVPHQICQLLSILWYGTWLLVILTRFGYDSNDIYRIFSTPRKARYNYSHSHYDSYRFLISHCLQAAPRRRDDKNIFGPYFAHYSTVKILWVYSTPWRQHNNNTFLSTIFYARHSASNASYLVSIYIHTNLQSASLDRWQFQYNSHVCKVLPFSWPSRLPNPSRKMRMIP